MTNQAIYTVEGYKIELRKEFYKEFYREFLEEAFREGYKEGYREGIEGNYVGTYNMLQEGYPLTTISNLLDVSISFVKAVQNKLHVPRTIELLKEGKLEIAGIAKKLKLPVLFVKAVKNNIDKNKQA